MSRIYKMMNLLILILTTSLLFGQEKDIIGYYPSWNWKDRNELVNSKTIPYEKLTMINYAFFIPLPNGKIVGKDPEADSHLLKSKIDSLTGEILENTSLIEIAHQQNVKVLISIGGWEDSDNFPMIAADTIKRANFAYWCVRHIKEYGFDGIDIDWEYPGYVPHNGMPEDKQNFTLLLQTVRDSLDILEKETGKYYLLSAALPATFSHTQKIDIQNVAKILDFMNIMTYDFFGPWGAISNHNAPLFAPAQGDPAHNFAAAFELYHEKYGIPANKINLGVPFYGHTFSACTKLHTEHQGGEKKLFSDVGNATYYEIADHIDSFTRFWDDKAQVPYLISKAKELFISYDDTLSIGLKADYVLKNKARGLIIWEIMGDYFENDDTPLLDVIHRKFYTR